MRTRRSPLGLARERSAEWDATEILPTNRVVMDAVAHRQVQWAVPGSNQRPPACKARGLPQPESLSSAWLRAI
jgi:hypothetical protein